MEFWERENLELLLQQLLVTGCNLIYIQWDVYGLTGIDTHWFVRLVRLSPNADFIEQFVAQRQCKIAVWMGVVRSYLIFAAVFQ